MSKRNLLFLILLTLLVFSSILRNGFVGDDEFLFVKNTFYRNVENIPDLFTSGYIADQDAIFNNKMEDINSGSVAYRPVLSATFFVDYWLWQDNPFGYHLTSLILHLANTLLLYGIIFLIFQSNTVSLLSSLIFALHPLKSEAVSSAGYRADSLACFFVLLALWFFMRADKKGVTSMMYSYIFFFLALFTKESAVVFPALAITYDHFIKKDSLNTIIKQFFSRYFGFFVILAFYLFIYINVFPNSSIAEVSLHSKTGITRVLTSFYILSHYLFVYFIPTSVKILPAPVLEPYERTPSLSHSSQH